jgi:hypothetical protein
LLQRELPQECRLCLLGLLQLVLPPQQLLLERLQLHLPEQPVPQAVQPELLQHSSHESLKGCRSLKALDLSFNPASRRKGYGESHALE